MTHFCPTSIFCLSRRWALCRAALICDCGRMCRCSGRRALSLFPSRMCRRQGTPIRGISRLGGTTAQG